MRVKRSLNCKYGDITAMPNTEKVDILVVSAYRGWLLLFLKQRHMVVLPCSACVYVYSNTISILYIGLAHHILFFL